MNIHHQIIQHPPFGRCLAIDNGCVELIVTLDVGPRIISFRRMNNDNVFFEDVEDDVSFSYPEMHQLFGQGATWHAYGGHRVWCSPETYASYYPDNHPVTYTVTPTGFEVYGPVQEETGFQTRTMVSFVGNTTLKVTSHLTNLAEKTRRVSLWSVIMMRGPGTEIVPLPTDQQPFTPQRYYTLWAFGAKNNDPRAFYGDDYFTLEVDTSNMDAYKVGMKVNAKRVFYLTKNDVFMLSFERHMDATYPDNNVNFETYTKGGYLELESLGPLTDLEAGASTEHTEYWHLEPLKEPLVSAKDDSDIDRWLRHYPTD